jgi:hypothetical protein
MKAYVILNKGYEYNDEIYHEPESGGGTPKKIYFTKADAKKEVIRLNIKEMKGTDIQQYAYDLEDIVGDVDGLKLYVDSLNTKYGIPTPKSSWDRPGEYTLNEKADDEESLKYMKFVSLSFYDIVETEVDDADFVKTFRESKLNEIL